MLRLITILFFSAFVFPIHAQNANELAQTSQDFIGVAKIATPAVVSIQVKSKRAQDKGAFDEYNPAFDAFQDDFFGRFFGIPNKEKQAKEIQVSQASGFIVSKDGYILTNNHVVKPHGNITVTLNDGREFPGKVIGEDETTDVALIKIEANDLPFLNLGDSNALEVGQWVVAIGNPLGLQASLTVGVVSAKGRNNLDIAKIEDFIQTDAAINQGNSGGPLLNLKAEVVGINTAIATNYANGYMGIGFAIPSTMAKHVMEQLLTDGSVTRGHLGIVLQQIDHDLAQSFDLAKLEGVLVAEVIRGSAAEKGGLKQGDILLRVNGKPIEEVGGFRNFIALQKPGTKITLSLLRDKKPLELILEIGSFKPTEEIVQTSALGFDVDTLTKELADSLNIQEEAGVIVVKVEPSSPAALIGLKRGALILAVNNQKIRDKEEFLQKISETPAGKPYLFLIKQGGTTRFVSLRVEL